MIIEIVRKTKVKPAMMKKNFMDKLKGLGMRIIIKRESYFIKDHLEVEMSIDYYITLSELIIVAIINLTNFSYGM